MIYTLLPFFFFFNDPPPTKIYTLPLHAPLPTPPPWPPPWRPRCWWPAGAVGAIRHPVPAMEATAALGARAPALVAERVPAPRPPLPATKKPRVSCCRRSSRPPTRRSQRCAPSATGPGPHRCHLLARGQRPRLQQQTRDRKSTRLKLQSHTELVCRLLLVT